MPAPLAAAGRRRSGQREGRTTDERAELVRLRRELPVKEMEIEILQRASAYFAREYVLPT